MKRLIYLLPLILLACTTRQEKPKIVNPTKQVSNTPYESEDFDVYKSSTQEALLILFPCFPCDAKNTASEFNIVETALNNGVSLLMMNFNNHLYLEEKEKYDLATMINIAISEHQLDTTNVFIGGFSGGGNVSLLLSNYLIKTKNIIQPKGVFMVDSPVDLLALYRVAESDIKKNFSEVSVRESKMIVQRLGEKFGKPEEGISKYEANAPFTLETNNLKNLEFLRNTEVRFYTEPDIKWWKENRQDEYEEMNAFYIKKCVDAMNEKFGNRKAIYYPTENRGYRANGVRHPHSWAIVDEAELVKWILK